MMNDWKPRPGDRIRVRCDHHPVIPEGGVVGFVEDIEMPPGTYSVWLTFPQYLPDGSAMVAVQCHAGQMEPL